MVNSELFGAFMKITNAQFSRCLDSSIVCGGRSNYPNLSDVKRPGSVAARRHSLTVYNQRNATERLPRIESSNTSSAGPCAIPAHTCSGSRCSSRGWQ